MKITAYIAICLLLFPSFSSVHGQGENSAASRLLQSIKNGKPIGGWKIPQLQKKKPIKVISKSNITNGETSEEKENLQTSSKDISKSNEPISNNSGTDLGGNSLVTQLQSTPPPIPKANLINEAKREGSLPEKTDDAISPEEPQRNPPPKAGDSSGGQSSKGQSFGLWWPVCVFVDGPDANSQIKDMVQMSAACGVNLVPYARTVSIPDPNNEAQINSLQSSSCNIKESKIAGKGSSLVLTNRSSTVADEMCGSYEEDKKTGKRPTKNVAGCNQLANGASGESKKRAESHKGKGDGFGGMASGEVAVGIVDREGYSSGAVYSHETMGHGQMGWPNGKKAGNGIGDPNDDKDSSGDHEHGGGYTAIGCAQMRASAIPDPDGYHKYYPNKERYYSHREDKKMPLGEPIWKSFKDGPDTPDLAKNSPNGVTRGLSNNSSNAGSFGRKSDDSGGSFHKKKLGSNSGSNSGDRGRRSGGLVGSLDKSSEASPTQRGNSESQVAGRAKSGNGDGSPAGLSTITADISKSSLNDPDNSNGSEGNSISQRNSNNESDASGFLSDDNRGVGSGNLGNDSEDSMDPDFFNDKKSGAVAANKSERRPRSGDKNIEKEKQEFNESALRSPAATSNSARPYFSPKNESGSPRLPSRKSGATSRGMRSQVSFGSND